MLGVAGWAKSVVSKKRPRAEPFLSRKGHYHHPHARVWPRVLSSPCFRLVQLGLDYARKAYSKQLYIARVFEGQHNAAFDLLAGQERCLCVVELNVESADSSAGVLCAADVRGGRRRGARQRRLHVGELDHVKVGATVTRRVVVVGK